MRSNPDFYLSDHGYVETLAGRQTPREVALDADYEHDLELDRQEHFYDGRMDRG